jgi:hypothetical protein
MAKQPSGGEKLPEPHHPFARWGAGAVVSLWAVGVQSLSDPWNKFGAILSPGLGYSAGLLLDLIFYHVSERSYENERQRLLSRNKRKLDTLYKERQDAISYGSDQKMISMIDAAIFQIQESNISVIRDDKKRR